MVFMVVRADLSTLDPPVMEGVDELLAVSLKSSDSVSFKCICPFQHDTTMDCCDVMMDCFFPEIQGCCEESSPRRQW